MSPSSASASASSTMRGLRARDERDLALGVELDAVDVAVAAGDRLLRAGEAADRRVAVDVRAGAPSRRAPRRRAAAARARGCRGRGRRAAARSSRRLRRRGREARRSTAAAADPSVWVWRALRWTLPKLGCARVNLVETLCPAASARGPQAAPQRAVPPTPSPTRFARSASTSASRSSTCSATTPTSRCSRSRASAGRRARACMPTPSTARGRCGGSARRKAPVGDGELPSFAVVDPGRARGRPAPDEPVLARSDPIHVDAHAHHDATDRVRLARRRRTARGRAARAAEGRRALPSRAGCERNVIAEIPGGERRARRRRRALRLGVARPGRDRQRVGRRRRAADRRGARAAASSSAACGSSRSRPRRSS